MLYITSTFKLIQIASTSNALKGTNVVAWKMKLFATSLKCFWECARLRKHRSIDLPRNIFMVGPRWSVLLSNYVLFAKLLYSEYTSADGAISRPFIMVKKERNLWTDMLLRYRGKQVDSIWILTQREETDEIQTTLGPVCEELYPKFVCTLIPGFLHVYHLVPMFEALNLCGQKARAMLFRILNTVPNRDWCHKAYILWTNC